MNRVLRLEIPPCQVSKALVDPTWTATHGLNGWTAFPITGLGPSTALSWIGTIDLSGYVRDQLTFYPQAAFIQQGSFLSEAAGEGSILYTIVSTIPLDSENVFFQLLSSQGGPGFLNNSFVAGFGQGADQQNYETVMFANSEVYVPNVNILPNPIGIQQPLTSNQSGSLEPTAADTLYVMKMWIPFGPTNSLTAISIPASRVIIPGKFGTEPDVEYMMRLKRSVELANQV